MGLTADRARTDVAPSAPGKSLRWTVACKPLASQPLGEKKKQRDGIEPQVSFLLLTKLKFRDSQYIFEEPVSIKARDGFVFL